MFKILLVEDSALIREVIAEMLQDCPQLSIADVATSSDEAIRLLEHQSYDMIVLDIELARGTGFDVVRHARQQASTPNIVMLTNHGNSYYRTLAHGLGVEYFFDKSLQFDECIAVIQQCASRMH